MKVNGWIIKSKGLVYSNGTMVISMLVIGFRISYMDLVNRYLVIKAFIKDISKMIKKKVMANSAGLKVLDTLENVKMINAVDKD